MALDGLADELPFSGRSGHPWVNKPGYVRLPKLKEFATLYIPCPRSIIILPYFTIFYAHYLVIDKESIHLQFCRWQGSSNIHQSSKSCKVTPPVHPSWFLNPVSWMLDLSWFIPQAILGSLVMWPSHPTNWKTLENHMLNPRWWGSCPRLKHLRRDRGPPLNPSLPVVALPRRSIEQDLESLPWNSGW